MAAEVAVAIRYLKSAIEDLEVGVVVNMERGTLPSELLAKGALKDMKAALKALEGKV